MSNYNQNFFTRLFGLDTAPKDAMSVKVKERFNPTSTLYATTILMLSELAKTQEEMLARSEKMRLAKRAEALGFTNSYAVAEQAQFNKNVELLKFMVEMWRDLGPQTILVGTEHFRDILRRHDLMCVPFEAYKGDIPTKNLGEIEQSRTKLLKMFQEDNDTYIKRLETYLANVRSSEELLEIIRLPYCTEKDFFESLERKKKGDEVLFSYQSRLNGRFFIAAPCEFVEKPKISINSKTTSYSFSWERDEKQRIINRGNEILKGVSEYANVTYSSIPKPLPSNYDPFVCSLCDHGVIIHSMWGAEAEDATIKRYEQLRDAIIGKGGEV